MVMFNKRKLPMGIQDFEDLRTKGCLYVDKTRYVYQLTRKHWHYLLGRPRSFGKSLLLTTLKEYFLGKKELFEGLAIAELEKELIEYPVFHIDMYFGGYSNLDSLYSVLDANLRRLEAQWGKDDDEQSPSARLYSLIRRAHAQTGRRVVVLIDEYDKPLHGSIELQNMNNDILTVLKGFYGVLKSADADLRFVFLTGAIKITRMSVFSELNHLIDISFFGDYAGICGISASEFVQNFEPEIAALAHKRGKTFDKTLGELEKHYYGYHFAKNADGMYNPWSLLQTFASGKLGYYWFESGTPDFLVKMLKDIEFDVKKLENDVLISSHAINDNRVGSNHPVPLMYQSGYLTIKDYDESIDAYILGFPNEEVMYGFLEELMLVYMPKTDMETEFYVVNFIEDLLEHNIESFMVRLKAFFAGIPYTLNNKTEKHYQTIFYILLKLMGRYIAVEQASAVGRADVVITTADTVYVFEFKLTGNGTAEDALQQIDDKGYLIPFTASNKRLVKTGVEFSTKTRGLHRWLISDKT